jgi:hypothetical protein
MIVNNKYLLRLRELSRARANVRQVRKMIARCRDYRRLTAAQKNEIQEYYLENYGQKINTLWHEYCYFMNGVYSVQYVPHDLYNNRILYSLNAEHLMPAYSDKNAYDLLFRETGVRQPAGILKNMHGVFYRDGRAVTVQEAEEACANLTRVIIKPALESGQGKDVRCFSSANGVTDCENLPVRKLLERYGRNFIVQEKVTQHPLLASLNESSLNTFRVITYRHSSGIAALNCALKIGREGEIVDNTFGGGCFTGVNIETGALKKYLFSVETGEKFEKTASGVVLDGLRIPFVGDIFQAACAMHRCLPYAEFVGWDIAANDRSEAVLIEANINGIGANNIQIACGPFFGEYTTHILNRIRRK